MKIFNFLFLFFILNISGIKSETAFHFEDPFAEFADLEESSNPSKLQKFKNKVCAFFKKNKKKIKILAAITAYLYLEKIGCDYIDEMCKGDWEDINIIQRLSVGWLMGLGKILIDSAKKIGFIKNFKSPDKLEIVFIDTTRPSETIFQ